MIVRQAHEDPSELAEIRRKKQQLREKVAAEKSKAVETATADEGKGGGQE